MGTHTGTDIDRRRRQIAASYRKQGYRVTAPTEAGSLPAFLSDCHPDLIAEKNDDRVVIEVKPARALKGTNDLVKLAERVAAEPGWRLELVALTSQDDDDALLLAPDWFGQMLQPVAPGGDDVTGAIYLVEVLTYLLRAIARRNALRLRDKSAERVAHELAFAGVIDETYLARIKDILAWRNGFMHGRPVSPSPAEQTSVIKKLCRDLHAQAQNSEG
jgi:REase_AHJR-like